MNKYTVKQAKLAVFTDIKLPKIKKDYKDK